jgi:hypothetical protein
LSLFVGTAHEGFSFLPAEKERLRGREELEREDVERNTYLLQRSMQRGRKPCTWIQDTGQEYRENTQQGAGGSSR